MKIKNNKGFSLLEILITVLIISISLLSIGVLQLKTHQHNNNANFQTHATVLAHDMMERMRSNPIGIKNNNYHLPTATQHSGCNTMAGCSSLELAQNDMYEWGGNGAQAINKKLPIGTAIVCRDSTPNDGVIGAVACDNIGSIYAVKIWWNGVDAVTQRFITTVGF
ncbi:MAG: type IV pilus modification protein PilV [Cocleimonas sp.]|nr:type IV pilus modification protein PilV [Cocleimonas sp.]